MADYYIHLENGSDSGAGTALDPWLTVQKFLNTVLGNTGPHRVHIAGEGTVPSLDWTAYSVGWTDLWRPVCFTQWLGQPRAILHNYDGEFNWSLTTPQRNKVSLIGLRLEQHAAGSHQFFQMRVQGCHFITHDGAGNPSINSGATNQFTECLFQGYGSAKPVSGGYLHKCIIESNGSTSNDTTSNMGTYMTNCLILLHTTQASTGMNTSNCVIDHCTIVNFNARGRVYGAGAFGVIKNSVFINGGAAGQLDIQAGPLCYSNRILNCTYPPQLPDPTVPFNNGFYMQDMGDNLILPESPYKDFANLDFTIVKPALLEINSPYDIVTPNKVYAGCFQPGVIRPFISSPFALNNTRGQNG